MYLPSQDQPIDANKVSLNKIEIELTPSPLMTGSSWLQEGQSVFFVWTKLVLLQSNLAPVYLCPFAQPLSSVIAAETDVRSTEVKGAYEHLIVLQFLFKDWTKNPRRAAHFSGHFANNRSADFSIDRDLRACRPVTASEIQRVPTRRRCQANRLLHDDVGAR